jgi:hypothetical protein
MKLLLTVTLFITSLLFNAQVDAIGLTKKLTLTPRGEQKRCPTNTNLCVFVNGKICYDPNGGTCCDDGSGKLFPCRKEKYTPPKASLPLFRENC